MIQQDTSHFWMGHNRPGRGPALFVAGAIFTFASGLRGEEPAAPPSDTADLLRISEAFNRVAEAVKPSVVNIAAMSADERVQGRARRFFGRQDLPRIPTTGTGSGVILDGAGHIVTNNHLVGDAEVISVSLADGRKFRARMIGTDPKTDLAVIKIEAEGLVPAMLGDSDQLKVGYLVLAIGSPFRLGHSVSHGIISAMGRSEVDVDIDYQNWLQTDAPINPGNSGGPLINPHGEVIGISVAIATESGGNQGVGFAIPSNTVRRIARQLQERGRVTRGYLGVSIQAVDERAADAYGLKQARGVLIGGIGEDSPAAKGGLRPEDIVLAVGPTEISTREQLQEVIAATAPGTTVPFTIWRNGTRKRLTITVGQQAEEFSTRGSLPPPASEDDPGPEDADATRGADVDQREEGSSGESLGFTAADLTDELRKTYRLPSSLKAGVVITRVDFTSEAWAANLRVGHVILRANDKPIRSLSDLEPVLTSTALARGVRLKVHSPEDDYFTVLRIR